MLKNLLENHKIIFFGGKGGVGKTTVSAACALARANELSVKNKNAKVLLVSTDPAHNLGHLFNRDIGAQATRLTENLFGLELDPNETVNQHLKEVGSSLRKLMPTHLSSEVDKHIELSRDAPGMQEAAMLERIAEIVEQSKDYELVIFDTAPSGHTSRLMALPEMMSAWTDGLINRRDKADKFTDILKNLGNEKKSGSTGLGDNIFGDNRNLDDEENRTASDRDGSIRHTLNRRRTRFSNLRDTFADESSTAFVIVLAAERLPVLETIELNNQLQRAGINVAGLVVNKRMPNEVNGFFAERKKQEEIHLATLNDALPNLAKQDITLVAQDVVGLEALQEFSEKLFI
ncbi:ArsA family ATPase [Aurantivibrio infirmus]